jgi:hypothetical protein
MTYGRPGVYISERLLPAPIAAAGTANAAGAAIGAFARGPEDVTLVTSWYDFVNTFGGYSTSYLATFGISSFFQNGGSELYVRRVLASDATASASPIAPASGSTAVGTITAKNKGADGNNLRFQLSASTIAGLWNLTVYREGGASSADTSASNDVLVETFTNVSLSDSLSSDYIVNVVGLNSKLITVSIEEPEVTPSTARIPLVGGSDGAAAPLAADYSAVLPDFETLDRPLVIFAPEISTVLGAVDGKTVQDAVVSWASTQDAFAVLDTPEGLDVATALTYASGFDATSFAAVYYPNFYVKDALGRSATSLRKIGPAGAIAGLYLSTDRATGPFKAPAGVTATIKGAVALEKAFTNAELDSLNSATSPINAIRNIPGSGVVSMGARTLLQDGTANKYVNMRRSLIYIKKSLNNLTQFALFENNNEQLWRRLDTIIDVFLNDYRNQGGLRGNTAAQAYFIKVDAENNTAESIANGEVHIEVGVALQYPAEFVVINLSQKTAI